MSGLDEAARRVSQGDASAFPALVEGTSKKLYRLALRITADPDGARDVLQEAYLSAYTALLRKEWAGRSKIEVWLYRIVVNAALNDRRGRIRRAETPVLPGERTYAARQETQVAVAQLLSLLHELPKDQRAAFVLKEVEGMTSAEIGDILGCSEGAVEQRLLRARTTLRNRWRDE